MPLRKDPKGGTGATPRHLRYGAAGEAGGLPEGPPNPQGPKGGTGATPRHTALRRGGGGRRPTRRAAPTPRTPRAAPAPPLVTCATARRERPEAYPKGRLYRQRSDPAPPEIGRGSKRALTHRAGKSNRLT